MEKTRGDDDFLNGPARGLLMTMPAAIPNHSKSNQTTATPFPQRPRWVKDDSHETCLNCKEEFNIFRRRHHCRNCGELFCGNCLKSIPIPDLEYNSPQYVCNSCLRKRTQTNS